MGGLDVLGDPFKPDAGESRDLDVRVEGEAAMALIDGFDGAVEVVACTVVLAGVRVEDLFPRTGLRQAQTVLLVGGGGEVRHTGH